MANNERRVHPSWIVLGAAATLRAMIVPLIIAVISSGGLFQFTGFAIVGAIALVGVVARALAWWRLTYEVTERELRVRSGLLSRTERLLPLERIQSVDISESVLQRLFGVVKVKVESAAGGGKGSDITLEALTQPDAAELRSTLLAKRGIVAAATAPPGAEPIPAAPAAVDEGPEPELLLALSTGHLLTAGATSGRVGPALGLLAATFQFADDIAPAWIWERLAIDPDVTISGIVFVATTIGIIAWLLAMASTVLTFGGFRLWRDGDRLLVSYGLLDRRRSTIPLARIQAVTITEGVLRQPFGLASVRVESAGYGADAPETGVLAPLVRLADLPDLLTRACPPYALDVTRLKLAGPPARARRRYIMPGVVTVVILAAAIAAGGALLPWVVWWWGLLLLILVPPFAAFGALEYRDAGWVLDDDGHFVVRARPLGRVTTITLRRRLQHRSVHQNWLQRQAGLATLGAAVASGGSGGRVHVQHLDESVAADLLARLGPPTTGRRAFQPLSGPAELPRRVGYGAAPE